MPLLGGCCSLDLQMGAKIIGVIFLIFTIIGSTTTSIICITISIMKDVIVEGLRNLFPPDDGTIMNSNFAESFRKTQANLRNDNELNFEPDKESYAELSDAANYLANNIQLLMIFFLIILGQQLLEMFVSSCLIHGIRRNRRGLLVPWMVMHVLYIFCELGLIALFITMTVYFRGIYHVILPMIAIDLCWMAIHTYFILVVISQFQALGLIRMHDEMSMKP